MRKRAAVGILAFAIVSAPSFITPLQSLHASPIGRGKAAVAGLSQSSGSLQDEAQPREASGNVTAYTLPPDLYKRAKTLGRIHFIFNLVSFFYGLFVLWLALRWKLAAKYREWAERASSNRFLQACVFAPPLILSIALLDSPTTIYEHIVSRTYGLSIEGWGALAWDWTKGIVVVIVLGSLLAWTLYGVMRQSPRRWWLYFWLISLPIIVFGAFVEPFVLEPCFSSLSRSRRKLRRSSTRSSGWSSDRV